MDIVDAGCGNAIGQAHMTHSVCGRCGHDDGWSCYDTQAEARKRQPCPECKLTR
jgi:hypothetical protein